MGLVREFVDEKGAGLVALSGFSEEDVALVVVGGSQETGLGGVKARRRG